MRIVGKMKAIRHQLKSETPSSKKQSMESVNEGRGRRSILVLAMHFHHNEREQVDRECEGDRTREWMEGRGCYGQEERSKQVDIPQMAS